MQIRKEQMKTLGDCMLQEFEDSMVAHVEKFFPGQHATMREAGVREIVRHGIERAEKYNIISERDVCKYIDVMFVYGRDFDVNPKLPWAIRILNDRRPQEPSERVNRLCREVMERQGIGGGNCE